MRTTDENEYRRLIIGNTTLQIRVSIVIAMLLLVAYIPLNAFMYANSPNLSWRVQLVTLVIIVLALYYVNATYQRTYLERSQSLGIALLVIVGACGGFLLSYSTVVEFLYIFLPVIMTIIYTLFFVGLFFRNAAIVSVFVSIVDTIAIWSATIPFAVALSLSVSLNVVICLLGMAAYQKELLSRQLFLAERRERETLTRQNQSDAQYLAWLRQLAKFLRHEVRHPVAQINSSIELIQLSCPPEHPHRPYLTNAALGAQQIWNLIERASRATDAEAFVRRSQPQSVDLKPLLSELIGSYRQTYSGVGFVFACSGSAVIEADPALIKEAAGNLLANAASYAAEDTNVEISLATTATSAIIRVRNHGELLDDDPERLFESFASARAGPTSEHYGLGLYLVRLIADHCGGKASICNIESIGVEASIELPLTA